MSHIQLAIEKKSNKNFNIFKAQRDYTKTDKAKKEWEREKKNPKMGEGEIQRNKSNLDWRNKHALDNHAGMTGYRKQRNKPAKLVKHPFMLAFVSDWSANGLPDHWLSVTCPYFVMTSFCWFVFFFLSAVVYDNFYHESLLLYLNLISLVLLSTCVFISCSCFCLGYYYNTIIVGFVFL